MECQAVQTQVLHPWINLQCLWGLQDLQAAPHGKAPNCPSTNEYPFWGDLGPSNYTSWIHHPFRTMPPIEKSPFWGVSWNPKLIPGDPPPFWDNPGMPKLHPTDKFPF